MTQFPDAGPGTYALLLGLTEPVRLQIGSLGEIHFDSPYYVYFGSAFGPGGLGARIRHHLNPVTRPHWHIDYLRESANVFDVWHVGDGERLECDWATAAAALDGVNPVSQFGASDCRCGSHLCAVTSRSGLQAMRDELPSILDIQSFSTGTG